MEIELLLYGRYSLFQQQQHIIRRRSTAWAGGGENTPRHTTSGSLDANSIKIRTR